MAAFVAPGARTPFVTENEIRVRARLAAAVLECSIVAGRLGPEADNAIITIREMARRLGAAQCSVVRVGKGELAMLRRAERAFDECDTVLCWAATTHERNTYERAAQRAGVAIDRLRALLAEAA